MHGPDASAPATVDLLLSKPTLIFPLCTPALAVSSPKMPSSPICHACHGKITYKYSSPAPVSHSLKRFLASPSRADVSSSVFSYQVIHSPHITLHHTTFYKLWATLCQGQCPFHCSIPTAQCVARHSSHGENVSWRDQLNYSVIQAAEDQHTVMGGEASRLNLKTRKRRGASEKRVHTKCMVNALPRALQQLFKGSY